MRNVLKIAAASLIVTGMTTPAFAHGGGGGYWRSEPQYVKAAAAANTAACAANTDKCISFGKHYHGQ